MGMAKYFTGIFLGAGLLFTSSLNAESPEHWIKQGQEAVTSAKSLKPNDGTAKNIILFIGDGMGISTITAARIMDGQLKGQSGEENSLSFEKLPYTALSKTYSVNQQTPDSAPTMSAIMTGVKTKDGLLSVNEYANRADYKSVADNKLTTFLELAELAGKSTGVVTTTRLTHATPAACYAHSAERDWEADADLPADAVAANFPDIARQLLEFPYGDGLEVALGGGRGKFIPNTLIDPEDAEDADRSRKGKARVIIPDESLKRGERKDGRNLPEEWLKKYRNSAYVYTEDQFNNIDTVKIDHLLGLFNHDHMEYEYHRVFDKGGEPSLAQMTAKAIDILSKNKKGYFLMVEAGRIDHAHHENIAYRALTETITLSNAVSIALERTNSVDTLIIVTADHSQVLSLAGFARRGNPILEYVMEAGKTKWSSDLRGEPYTVLTYANGPGNGGANRAEGPTSKFYNQKPAVYLPISTHAGEDVAIFAGGPKAYLFHGAMEQNVIFHIMTEAMGLKSGN